MTDQITTKPMRSRSQWRWAFAAGKPFAKRWARGTPGGKVKRYRKLPNKVKKKESPLLLLLKANYGAKRGQVIQGRLVRGEGGRFSSSGGGKPTTASSTTTSRRRTPPKTEEQRAADRASAREQRTQERAATQEQNIAETFSAIGMSEDAADSLRRLAAGEPVEDGGGLVKMGLAEQAKDGSYRLTAAGRAVMNAAERGDIGAARDAKSKAQDKATAADEAAAAKLLEPPPAAGGGGGEKKDPVKLPPRQTSRLAKPILGGGGGGKKKEPPKARAQTDPALTALARRLSAGESLNEEEEQTLIRNGLARVVKGTLILTQSGMRSIRGKSAERLFSILKAPNPSDYLVVEDRTKPSTWHLPVKKNGTPDHRLMGAAWAALHGGYRGNAYEGPQKDAALAKLRRLYQSEGMEIPKGKSHQLEYAAPRLRALRKPLHADEGTSIASSLAAFKDHVTPSFIVYKDHDGTPRWIARSTTAYRDRDREILPIATLDLDSQRMTATKQYGPLRWWHVGKPNALNTEQPWGVGLDLGWCDFSMQIGRTRVESGTFKDEQIARRIAATASSYELSPGFFHAANEPDASGIFHSIHTFERSLVPIRYGRASNLFTGLTIKEHTTMDAAEQERRFKAFVEELKLSPDQAAAYAAGLVATDKAASTTPDPATGQPGVAYKSDERPPAGFMDNLRRWLNANDEVPPQATTTKAEEKASDGQTINTPADPLIHAIAAQTAQIADLTSTLKAAMEAPIEEEMEEVAVEEEEAPVAEESEARTLADLSVDEFASLLGQVLAQSLAGAMGGISDKVSQLDEEMKGMGYTRVKEEQEKADKIAALKVQIDQQQSQLADLLGDQPAIKPTRPSEDPNNILQGLKDADPTQPEFAFADISAHLFGQQPAAH